MKLSEAIKHCEDVVRQYEGFKELGLATFEDCECATEHRQLANWLNELKYARVLLKATYEIFKKCDDSSYVLNALEQTAFYDGVECDGYCLMEDIESFMEEWDDN